ncbi:hypothetical protein CCMA1212_010507 [Trichoderma ghanense]|uniref:Uncharacterized protein n=1 Tax=Trichoderma ghanense TaxID=65468 RepID=A0ABY2GQA6_9HYPO
MLPGASPIHTGGKRNLRASRSADSSPTGVLDALSHPSLCSEEETSTNNVSHISPHASRLTDLFLKKGSSSTTRVFP